MDNTKQQLLLNNNAKQQQLLNLKVFYTSLTYLCKGSPPCYVSTVALVSAAFALIFPQHFSLQNSQLNLSHLLLNSCIASGMAGTCTMKSGQKFIVV